MLLYISAIMPWSTVIPVSVRYNTTLVLVRQHVPISHETYNIFDIASIGTECNNDATLS